MQRPLEYAATLAEFGLWVIPLKAQAKTPLLRKGWKEVSTNDPQVVLSWLEVDPHANYGVDMARNGLIGLDADVKNGIDGVANLKRWATDTDLDTVISFTASGGRHYWFRAPNQRYGNSPGSLPPGIDVRGAGGYLVGPGSYVGGRPYRMNVQQGVNWPRYVKPASAQLLDALAPPLMVVRQPQIAPTGITHDLSAYAAAALQGELSKLDGLKDGMRRRDTLYKVACKLGQLLGAGAFESRDDLVERLHAGQQERMAQQLEFHHAARSIERGLDWGVARPRLLRGIDGAIGR